MQLMTALVHTVSRAGHTTTFSWIGKQAGLVASRVHAFAYTPQGGILLVGGPSATQWWLPGGGIEAGESEEQALQRELLEEAGAVIGERELLGYQRVDDSRHGVSHHARFWCRIILPSEFASPSEVTRTIVVEPERFLDVLWWSDDPAAGHLLQLAAEAERRRSRA